MNKEEKEEQIIQRYLYAFVATKKDGVMTTKPVKVKYITQTKE